MTGSFVKFDRSATIFIILIAAFVPFFASAYETKLATTILIQAGLAVSLGLIVGLAGLVSVGHAAFYGLAAYLVALAAPDYGTVSILYIAAVSISGAAIYAGLVGIFSLRSKGLYFILMTLAFGQLGYHFFHDMGLVGSADGRYFNATAELSVGEVGVYFDKPNYLYALAWTTLCVTVFLCWQLRRSVLGKIILAARDNEVRVRAFGFSPYLLRLFLFTLSGAMAGAMGCLTAVKDGFVTPEFLNWHLSATILVMVLIGGKDTVSGPLIGAVVLVMAEEILQRRTEYWLVGVGLIVISTVMFAPRGLIPFAHACIASLIVRKRENSLQDEARV